MRLLFSFSRGWKVMSGFSNSVLIRSFISDSFFCRCSSPMRSDSGRYSPLFRRAALLMHGLKEYCATSASSIARFAFSRTRKRRSVP